MSAKYHFGLCCPGCADDTALEVFARISVNLHADGTITPVPGEQYAWEPHDRVYCDTCKRIGTASDFAFDEDDESTED